MLESSVFLRQVSEGRLLPDHLVFVASLNSITVVPVKTLSGGGAWRERGSGEKRGKSRRSRRSEFATEYAYEVRVCESVWRNTLNICKQPRSRFDRVTD